MRDFYLFLFFFLFLISFLDPEKNEQLETDDRSQNYTLLQIEAENTTRIILHAHRLLQFLRKEFDLSSRYKTEDLEMF